MRYVFLNVFRQFGQNALAIAAVAIGICSLTLSVGVLTGITHAFQQFVTETGAFDTITVAITGPTGRGMGPLTADDADYLRENLREEAIIGGELVWWHYNVTMNGTSRDVILAGIDQDTFSALRHQVEFGRGLSSMDIQRHSRVIVVGRKLADSYSKNPADCIGQSIIIKGVSYQIVGVLRRYSYYDGQISTDLPFKNGYTFVPLTTAQDAHFAGRNYVSYIQVRARSLAMIPQIAARIEDLLSVKRRDMQGVGIQTTRAQAVQWQKTQQAVRIGIWMLCGAALIIGASAVVNTQLASVIQRIRELGIRRAIGSSATDIILLVISESILISLIGGALGVAMACCLKPGVAYILPHDLPGGPVFVWWTIPASLGTSALVGVISGLWPAIKAARLDPLEAVRVY